MHDYRRIADRIATDITTGRLRPGERLPPQRKFARRHGIAASTAERPTANSYGGDWSSGRSDAAPS